MKNRKKYTNSPILPLLLVLTATTTAHAADVTWDVDPGTVGVGNGTVTGGTGTWDTTNGNWTVDAGINNVAWNNGANNTALFGGTAGTVTLGTDVNVSGLEFSAGGYIIEGGGNSIILGNNGGIRETNTPGPSLWTSIGTTTINADIDNNGFLFTTVGGGTAILNGVISGSGGFATYASSNVTLAGDNTYTGKTSIISDTTSGSTLRVSSFNSVNADSNGLNGIPSFTSSSLGAPTTVANGTIQLGRGGKRASCTLIYTGSGETTDRVINLQFDSSAKQTITSNATGGGLLKFTSNFTINPGNGNSSGGLNLRGSGRGEIAQIGTLPGALEKLDAGTWTVSGTNSTDRVTISTGILMLHGNYTARSTIFSVNGTSTLGGTATITAAAPDTVVVTVAAGANLTPGASVGTLTVDGTLDVSAMTGGTGVANFELDTIAASDMIIADSVNIGTLEFDDFNFTALGGLENGTYTLIQSDALTGSLGGVLSGSVGAGAGTLQLSGDGTDVELVVSGLAGGSAYDTWAATNAPGQNPDDDFDEDGVSNAVEFVLGGDKDTKDLGKLPTISTEGTDMLFTFVRDQESIDASTAATIEVGTTLAAWPDSYSVPDTDTGGVVNPGVTVVSGAGTDTVTLRIPKGADTEKFARLKVVITP